MSKPIRVNISKTMVDHIRATSAIDDIINDEADRCIRVMCERMDAEVMGLPDPHPDFTTWLTGLWDDDDGDDE